MKSQKLLCAILLPTTYNTLMATKDALDNNVRRIQSYAMSCYTAGSG